MTEEKNKKPSTKSEASDQHRVVMCSNASPLTSGVEKPATLEEWKGKAEFLWALLDDIDTYGDMLKPEITNYFKAVNKKAAQRHEVLQSDGYKIINI